MYSSYLPILSSSILTEKIMKNLIEEYIEKFNLIITLPILNKINICKCYHLLFVIRYNMAQGTYCTKNSSYVIISHHYLLQQLYFLTALYCIIHLLDQAPLTYSGCRLKGSQIMGSFGSNKNNAKQDLFHFLFSFVSKLSNQSGIKLKLKFKNMFCFVFNKP